MLQHILTTLKNLSYQVFTEPFQLNIIGLRSATVISNKFNDKLAVFFKDVKGTWVCFTFPVTTLPGLYWLRNPASKLGTAILLPGQYINTYQIGMHRGKYRALIQTKPVTVLRDNNRNAFADVQITDKETGLFGINIHRAAADETLNKIGKYSAGCQVFQNPHHFSTFMDLAAMHKKVHGNSFTYTLLSDELL